MWKNRVFRRQKTRPSTPGSWERRVSAPENNLRSLRGLRGKFAFLPPKTTFVHFVASVEKSRFVPQLSRNRQLTQLPKQVVDIQRLREHGRGPGGNGAAMVFDAGKIQQHDDRVRPASEAIRSRSRSNSSPLRSEPSNIAATAPSTPPRLRRRNRTVEYPHSRHAADSHSPISKHRA